MSPSDPVRAAWSAYVDSMPAGAVPDEPPPTERFGDSDEMADRLGELVVAGTKTATCSAVWEYEAEGEASPRVGDRAIVVDGAGAPLCLREITEVRVLAFSEVDARFAFDEGEGERTLEAWRRDHWAFFTRSLAAIGRVPSEDMPLVCERFRVVHRWV